MADAPARKAKPKEVQVITAAYVKDDGSSSMRRLLTTDSLRPASTILALDVSDLKGPELEAATECFKGYQQALAEHMAGFPSVADWMKARGQPASIKSFKIEGLKGVVTATA